ncbi:MAG: transposase [Planctomycetota bacterium]
MVCSTTVEGPINGDVLEAFVEQVLIHELHPGDIVVMDNLSSRKRPRVRELIESVGAELRLLKPYSPDLNPIEMVFSKIKRKLRDLAYRTKDALCHERDLGGTSEIVGRVRSTAGIFQRMLRSEFCLDDLVRIK